MNASGYNYQAWCFADIKGYQKCFTYNCNANADGPFIYTGFKPKFILFWNTSNDGRQAILDTARATYNPMNTMIRANSNDAESNSNDYLMDFVSNGIKIRTASTGNANHTSGNICVGVAIAEEPLVASNGTPATAR